MSEQANVPQENKPYQQQQEDQQEYDFTLLRRKENQTYRQMCKDAAKAIDVSYFDKLAFFLIKKAGERYEEEVNVLKKWTSKFKFFQELNSKSSNVNMRIQEKCCARMRYERISKGSQVFMAGEIPQKFYIILSGEVNVMLQKSHEVIEEEIKKQQELQKKIAVKDQALSISQRVHKLKEQRQLLLKIDQLQTFYEQDSIQTNPLLLDNQNGKKVGNVSAQSSIASNYLKQASNLYQEASSGNLKLRLSLSKVSRNSKDMSSSPLTANTKFLKLYQQDNSKRGGVERKGSSSSSQQEARRIGLELNNMGFTELLQFNPNLQDIENDPVFIGMGKIALSDLKDPEKFITDSILTHKYLLTLGEGQMFGELGLLMKKPRAASVIAKEDSEFATLDANDFLQILQSGEMRRFNRRINFFTSSLLQNCGREVVIKFSYNFQKMKFTKGQFIYKQDESPQFVYLVKKGIIRMQKKLEVNEENESIFDYGYVNQKQQKKNQLSFIHKPKQFITLNISEFTQGQSFGEMEVMKQCNRTTSTFCISQTATIYSLSIQNFLSLLNENKFLVKDFQAQVGMKESFKEQKIDMYFESIGKHNLENKKQLEKSNRVLVVNKKFTRQKENPTVFDFITKPFHPPLNLEESFENKSERPNGNSTQEIEVDDDMFQNSAYADFVCSVSKSKEEKLRELKKRNPNIDDGAEIFSSLQICKKLNKKKVGNRSKMGTSSRRSSQVSLYEKSPNIKAEQIDQVNSLLQSLNLSNNESTQSFKKGSKSSIYQLSKEESSTNCQTPQNDSVEPSSPLKPLKELSGSLFKYQSQLSMEDKPSLQLQQDEIDEQYLSEQKSSAAATSSHEAYDQLKRQFFDVTLKNQIQEQESKHSFIQSLQSSFQLLLPSPLKSSQDNKNSNHFKNINMSKKFSSDLYNTMETPRLQPQQKLPQQRLIQEYYILSDYSKHKKQANLAQQKKQQQQKCDSYNMINNNEILVEQKCQQKDKSQSNELMGQKKSNSQTTLSLISFGSDSYKKYSLQKPLKSDDYSIHDYPLTERSNLFPQSSSNNSRVSSKSSESGNKMKRPYELDSRINKKIISISSTQQQKGIINEGIKNSIDESLIQLLNINNIKNCNLSNQNQNNKKSLSNQSQGSNIQGKLVGQNNRLNEIVGDKYKQIRLPSKHNLFRSKPSKAYLQDRYLTNSLSPL